MVLLKAVVRGQGSGVSRKTKLLLFFALFTIHCSLFTSSAFAEEKVYIIKIEGMHCKMCVHRVTKSLKKLKEVREVEVDLDEGTATVLLNDGADVEKKALENAVEDAGYKPVGIK